MSDISPPPFLNQTEVTQLTPTEKRRWQKKKKKQRQKASKERKLQEEKEESLKSRKGGKVNLRDLFHQLGVKDERTIRETTKLLQSGKISDLAALKKFVQK